MILHVQQGVIYLPHQENTMYYCDKVSYTATGERNKLLEAQENRFFVHRYALFRSRCKDNPIFLILSRLYEY
jgi:hypothetical protein